jgi:hypothetical protein
VTDSIASSTKPTMINTLPRVAYNFAAACVEFEKTLLTPLEPLVRQQPYLALYALASIIDTLAGAHLDVTAETGRRLYITFVEALPGYKQTSKNNTELSHAMYYAYRCGLLHASVLHATPPPIGKKKPSTIPVAFTGTDRAPREQDGHWFIGTLHLFNTLKEHFSAFRSLSDFAAEEHGPARKTNFPVRFGPMTVTEVPIMSVDTSGAIFLATESASAR